MKRKRDGVAQYACPRKGDGEADPSSEAARPFLSWLEGDQMRKGVLGSTFVAGVLLSACFPWHPEASRCSETKIVVAVMNGSDFGSVIPNPIHPARIVPVASSVETHAGILDQLRANPRLGQRLVVKPLSWARSWQSHPDWYDTRDTLRQPFAETAQAIAEQLSALRSGEPCSEAIVLVSSLAGLPSLYLFGANMDGGLTSWVRAIVAINSPLAGIRDPIRREAINAMLVACPDCNALEDLLSPDIVATVERGAKRVDAVLISDIRDAIVPPDSPRNLWRHHLVDSGCELSWASLLKNGDTCHSQALRLPETAQHVVAAIVESPPSWPARRRKL